jgi:hypothetical protein
MEETVNVIRKHKTRRNNYTTKKRIIPFNPGYAVPEGSAFFTSSSVSPD